VQRIQPIRRLISNRPLAALVGAGAASSAGDWLYLTALPVLVYERTGDPALVGLAAAARLVPFFLLSMPAGVVADRFPRRSILILSETVRALAMLAIAWLCVGGADILGIVVLTLIAAAAGTFSMPATGSLVPELAADDAELGLANTIRATLDSLSGVLGPTLAGVLIVTGGLPVAFALNGISFALVAASLLIWRPRSSRVASRGAPNPANEASGPDLGWNALIRRVAGPLALDGAISFASGAIGVLAVLIAVDWLGAGEPFTGALNAGAGLGGIAGGIATGAVINGNVRVGLIAGIVSFAGAFVVLGMVAIPAIAVGAMAVAFAGLILLDTINMTTIQRLTADGGTGRAIGLIHTLAATWMMAGVIVPTLCAATFGIQAAIFAPAVVMVGLGALSLATSDGGARDEAEAGLLAIAPA
jgi:MFS family permease